MHRTLELLAEKDGEGKQESSATTFKGFVKDVFTDLGSVSGLDMDEEKMTGKFVISGDGWKANCSITGDKTGAVSIVAVESGDSLAKLDIAEDNIESVMGAIYGFIASGLEGA